MTFGPGDSVHVAALGKGTVREVRNGERYLVDVKGRSIVAAASQLTAVEVPKASRRAKTAILSAEESSVAGQETAASSSLDLHGKTVAEGLDALNAFLNSAFLAGDAEVRIIHGRSGGKIKAAVHAQLKVMASIRRFGLDPRNPGVTIVKL